jgi:hypothetical protein
MDSSAWSLVSKEKVQRGFRSLARWHGAKSEVEALRRMVPYSATKAQWDWCNQYHIWRTVNGVEVEPHDRRIVSYCSLYLQVSARKSTYYSVSVALSGHYAR